MAETRIYSERLGAIADAQFAAVAERWDLGRFVEASPITSGLFGQNVFVTTTAGEFVLRAAPHWVKGLDEAEYRREDRWQFTKERWFAGQLHAHTCAPVPWPMLHDETPDIFGWPYLVMPRMPGVCPDQQSIRTKLTPDDRRAVALAMGETLAEMQRLTWAFAGDFSQETIALEPYPAGGIDWTAREAMMLVRACGDRLSADDIGWIERAAADAPREAVNTYVHCDYKLGNVTLVKDGGAWRVGGLFDFHEARFADGTLDLVRAACAWFDTEPELAAIFRRAWGKPFDARRMTLYVLNDRLKIFEYFSRPDAPIDWLKGKPFRPWAERYVEKMLKLL
jgi:aminoglycoside phosphotransferase (APT) family kinase protein